MASPRLRESAPMGVSSGDRVTIVIPARNEEEAVPRLAEALAEQTATGVEIEVLLIDDGSDDGTVQRARAAGFRVLHLPAKGQGNPARARNLGAREASGDPVIFLDADCLPNPGWLAALLQHHDQGETIVGGSLDLPSGLSWTARLDYYCGQYHVHSRRKAGYVHNHPPANLSVDREVFSSTDGFFEGGFQAYAHEELDLQSQLRDLGHRPFFEPLAIVTHYNRRGLGNLLRRNYRWGYSAIESKSKTRTVRLAGIYSYPRTLIVSAVFLAPVQCAYVIVCWLRARRLEPLLMFPFILAARVAYSLGFAIGGYRWLRRLGMSEDSLHHFAD